ncbi:fimbrial biogenesis outer membrane usher protein [Roseomonas hellenica]|uniref:Fimbrial biogenesis outer membrane usher protein n=1 Tax=Plastoroseomonas hellenica TaxID=2687306 RepID=A0ABS5F3C3_9PROT|nr:fimbria/pilus outer membrane usher protein [Plastoroseomonas hellenica]MBR0667021.1 fimbrial biogenesis outer membrane usher protein [Plastoroseomonas hellenica]
MRAADARAAPAALLAVILAILLATMAPKPARAQDQPLLLEIVVNGRPIGRIGEFVLRDGALLARPEELRDLGFRVPEAVRPGPDGLIPLAALTAISWRLDQPTQALHATAPVEALLPALLATGAAAAGGPVQSGTGATLNYDVTGTSVDRANTVSGLLDLRVFSPWGVLSSGMLATAGADAGRGTNATVRLDTTYTFSDPENLRQYRGGDVITGGLAWTRPVRMGGAQISSNFALRPDLVTFPLPSVGGSVAVPSTVDVLVNGTRLLSREVQPGPFQVPQLPVVTGAGTVAMTVTDALGRQVSTTLPFYASSALLAPGLETYSASLGAIRRNWGVVSDDYGELAGAVSYRRGISEMLTLEAHGEGASGLAMGGGGLVLNIGNLGALNLSAAASSAAGRTGSQFSIGVQRIGTDISFGASVTLADRNFRDIAAVNGDPVPRRQLNANLGLSLGRFGSLGFAYTGIERDAAPAPIRFFAAPGTVLDYGGALPTGGPVSFQPAQDAHVVSASYSVQLGDVSAYATGFRDFARGGGSGFLVGLTMPLGPRSSAGVSGGTTSGRGYGQAQATQSPVSDGDWGYQAYAAAGGTERAFAELQYRSPWARVAVGADRIDRQTVLRAQAQGALSVIGGGVFASNTINDSFAVVDTNGVAGVRVLNENRLVGRTGSGGRLILPELRSFDVNRVAIEPTDIPADAAVPVTSREVRPQDRSGIVLGFPVQVSRGALLRLVDAAGSAIPVGSRATLQATGATVPVGYDGEAFVQDLGAEDNRVTVERPDGRRCVASFAYRAVPGEIPTIGPLPCRDEPP